MSRKQARDQRRFWEQIKEQLQDKIELAIEDLSVTDEEFDTLLKSKKYCYDRIAECIQYEYQ